MGSTGAMGKALVPPLERQHVAFRQTRTRSMPWDRPESCNSYSIAAAHGVFQ
jgi:hypothetical protein